MKTDIKITAEPSATDPSLCLFRLEEPIHDGRLNVVGLEDAAGSPLLKDIFSIPNVQQILVDKNTLLVQRTGDVAWAEAARQIGEILRKHLSAGGKLFPGGQDQPSRDEDFGRKVKRILDKEVNPSLAAHRGRVDLIEVKGKDVYVKFSGGCQGCAAAQMTLKAGVESILRKQVAGLGKIIDATDHAAGQKPYFKSDATDAASPFQK